MAIMQHMSNARDVSFSKRQKSTLDVVEEENGNTFSIPAQVGSTYWAILKVCYTYHDQPLREEYIIHAAAELMEDRDPEKWEKFKNKKYVKTQRNGQSVEKQAKSWQSRLATSIKTLTRTGSDYDYGKRLTNKGHILRWEPHHFEGQGAYVLRTDTCQPLPKKKNQKRRENVECGRT